VKARRRLEEGGVGLGWGGVIEIDSTVTGSEGVNWIDLIRDRDKCRALTELLLTGGGTGSF
jgi:hypothetical protein